MITIIDYGMGNLGSISNMIKKVGGNCRFVNSKKDIESSEKIILPGVGSFDQAIKNLKSLELIDPIKESAQKGIPILGICLGMQLLADSSEEGYLPGLGLINGRVIKFKDDIGVKIPHMGWNLVNYNDKSFLFNDFNTFEETRFYFVHSYYFNCQLESNIASTTNYSLQFASSIINNNIFGVQFHPEKSHKYGAKLLKNFIDL